VGGRGALEVTSYVTPKKNSAFIFYVGLVSQANGSIFQANPTLAAGDAKVSIDGGALANLATLPTVTPASGKMVKVSLSAAEMNGDNITVVLSDAAGAEWCDVVANIQTSARQMDDLAFPATSGRSIAVDAAGLVDANTVKVGPTGAGTAQTARDVGASVIAASVTGNVGGNVVGSVASVTGNVGGNVVGSVASVTAGVTLAAAAVQAIWDKLTSTLTTVGSIGKLLADNIDAAISSRLATTGYTAPLTAATTRSAVGLASANLDTQLATIAGYIDTEVGAIKAKTDQLTFTVAGVLDVDVTYWKAAVAPAMTGDAYARLGAPAGASVSADIAAIAGGNYKQVVYRAAPKTPTQPKKPRKDGHL
jgi:hypothetical protein